MHQIDIPEEYSKLSIEKAKDIFSVSKDTLRKRLKDGTLSAVHDEGGKRWLQFSELARVYDLRPEVAEEWKTGGGEQGAGSSERKAVEDELRIRVDKLEQQLEKREEDNDFLKGLLIERDGMVKALTDQREGSDKEAEKKVAAEKKAQAEEVERAKREEEGRFDKFREIMKEERGADRKEAARREERNAEELAKAKAWMARQVAESRRLAEESRKPWWEKILSSKREEGRLPENRDRSARRSV